ncbi:hypothetical protein [Diaminobutyricimonas sp. LJ205]|uniref:hypothetical protein n=1 Tax=Diaminobutyricimonas sp. LJ205 TaxID=2683590 RepID=UPI0012F4ECB9|nr:hypothetical protein [Diaminobutyricimonas sp. LJ205]
MTAVHKDPLYIKNARIVRAQTNARLKRGDQVNCGKCGHAIQSGQRYDVGHIIDASRGGTHDLHNLRPEHRHENRSAGGRVGAAVTNATSRRARRLPTW